MIFEKSHANCLDEVDEIFKYGKCSTKDETKAFKPHQRKTLAIEVVLNSCELTVIITIITVGCNVPCLDPALQSADVLILTEQHLSFETQYPRSVRSVRCRTWSRSFRRSSL